MNSIKNPGSLISLLHEMDKRPTGRCVSEEELALFLEKKADKEQRDNIAGHLASCNRCYEAFLVASDLYGSEKRSFLRTIPVRAIAATILVVFFSVYLFFKLNVKRSDISGDKNIKNIISRRYGNEKKEVECKSSGQSSYRVKRLKKTIKKKTRRVKMTHVIEDKREKAAPVKEDQKNFPVILSETRAKAIKEESAGIEGGDDNHRGKVETDLRAFKRVLTPSPVREFSTVIKTVDVESKGRSLPPGIVVADIEINNRGNVKKINFIDVDKNFEQSIRKSLKQWKFTTSCGEKCSFKLFAEYNSFGKWSVKKISGGKSSGISDR